MIGLTHAIGGASSILIAKELAPDTFQINIWLIILSFYISQLPDIDIKNSDISKNPFVKPIRLILSPFIDGHRAKQTHSLFGVLIYLLISLPFILFFGVTGWLLLGIAYFSHIFLDYFNPTGVKLFYFPIINNNPRSWSLYNTPFLLLSEIPYYLKKIFIWGKNRKYIKRKEIKFDGVGVMTGQTFEKFITYSLWVIFTILIIFNYQELKDHFLIDSYILSLFPLISIIIYFTLLIKERKIIIKKYKHFGIFAFIGIIFIVLSKFGILNGEISKQLNNTDLISLLFFLLIFSIIPLAYFLLFSVFQNIINLPKMIIPSKNSTSYFNQTIKYPTLTHFLLIILLLTSLYNIENYQINLNKNINTIKNIEFTKETGQNFIDYIKDQYQKAYKEIDIKKIND